MVHSFIATVALLLLFATSSALGQGSATNDPCIYQVGGKYFDFRSISNSDAKVQQPNTPIDVSYTFQFNPCKPVSLSSSSICPSGSLNCQLNFGTPYKLVANQISLSSMSYDGTTLSVTYTGGDSCPSYSTNRQSTIKFTCETSTGTPTYSGEVTCAYTFNWASTAGCPLNSLPGDAGTGGGSSGLSGGDIFLILFFCIGFLYVVIGMAYNYKFRELRGAEMVPNVDFWRGLPSLIKDGCVFTWQKITGLCSKN